MLHASTPFRLAFALLAAGLCIQAAGCAPASGAAPAPVPGACRDLTPARPAGRAHHLRGDRQLMGTSFQVRVVTPDVAGGCAAIEDAFAEVAREEALFSETGRQARHFKNKGFQRKHYKKCIHPSAYRLAQRFRKKSQSASLRK